MVLVLEQASQALLSELAESELRKAIHEWSSDPVKINIKFGVVQHETPAMRYERVQLETQQRIEKLVRDDPFIRQLQNEFGGEIVPNSIVFKK